jgi:hypothetical protein
VLHERSWLRERAQPSYIGVKTTPALTNQRVMTRQTGFSHE